MKKIEDELIRAMMDQHVNEGRELFGKGGMIQELTKRMMEKMLEAELEDHLGYARGERGSERRDNTRNGTSSKRVRTDNGEIPIDVPRDREGSFEPQLVKKHQRRLSGFDDRVLSLYAKGMSTRDIQQHLTEVYGTEISPQLVTRVTHAVLEDIREWRSRPLQAVWPIVYLDALVIRVREGGVVRRKSVYLAIGVGVEGTKEVLGMWLEETEGAKFWLRVINELKSRGIEDIFIACVDGLKGFPQAIEAVFPKTTVQTCIVHMIRNSTRFVNYKDRKAVAAALKPIYTAINRDDAATSLEGFEAEDPGRRVVFAWARFEPSQN